MAITACRECGGTLSTLAPMCPHCGAPAAASAAKIPEPHQAPDGVLCPTCGFRTGNQVHGDEAACFECEANASAPGSGRRVLKGVLIGLPIIGLLLYIAMKRETDESPRPPVAAPVLPLKLGLNLIDVEMVTRAYGARRIVGTVKNNSSKSYEFVSIKFNLYDDAGAQVGSTLDNVHNLEPHGIWKFEAVVTESQATRCKMTDLSGR